VAPGTLDERGIAQAHVADFKSADLLHLHNQIREKIGVMFGGNPETTPGGRALKFYASMRSISAESGQLSRPTASSRYRTRVKVVKKR